MNQLDQLKEFTKVVADTGDFTPLQQFAPQDATTNPSLIPKAVLMPAYQPLVKKTIADARQSGAVGPALLEAVSSRLLGRFGLEILRIVPGCDLLTITPAMLGESQAATDPVPRKLNSVPAAENQIGRRMLDEKSFAGSPMKRAGRRGHPPVPRGRAQAGAVHHLAIVI